MVGMSTKVEGSIQSFLLLLIPQPVFSVLQYSSVRGSNDVQRAPRSIEFGTLLSCSILTSDQ